MYYSERMSSEIADTRNYLQRLDDFKRIVADTSRGLEDLKRASAGLNVETFELFGGPEMASHPHRKTMLEFSLRRVLNVRVSADINFQMFLLPKMLGLPMEILERLVQIVIETDPHAACASVRELLEKRAGLDEKIRNILNRIIEAASAVSDATARTVGEVKNATG